MTFRISWIGLIFLLGTIGPNLIWTRNKPEDYEKYLTIISEETDRL